MDIVTFEFSTAFVHSVALHLLICVGMWFLVIAAIFTDLCDRVYTQKKLKKPLFSHRMRKTIDKVGEYWRFLVIAFMIDAVIFVACTLLGYRSAPFVTLVFTIIQLIIEVKSLFEHARERKTSVAEMQEIIKKVVEAGSDRDAKQAIKAVVEYIEDASDSAKEKGK